MNNLLHPQQLHAHQKECVHHMLQYDDSMLGMGMGLGKSIVTLTAIVERKLEGML